MFLHSLCAQVAAVAHTTCRIVGCLGETTAVDDFVPCLTSPGWTRQTRISTTVYLLYSILGLERSVRQLQLVIVLRTRAGDLQLDSLGTQISIPKRRRRVTRQGPGGPFHRALRGRLASPSSRRSHLKSFKLHFRWAHICGIFHRKHTGSKQYAAHMLQQLKEEHMPVATFA